MSRRIIVVGGGIAGLAAAHRLAELDRERSLGLEINLLEAAPRLGGSIATEQVDDFLVERGPDSFITEKPWALALCERLGLTSRLISTNPAHQSVYVVHRGRLQPLPEGFLLMAPTRLWPLIRTPLFSWPGKLRMAMEFFVPPRTEGGDESLAAFVRRRFGAEVLDRVAQPLIGGIYASDPEKLSLESTMPRFLEMERNRRSIIRAMWSARRRPAGESRAGSGARWSLFVTLRGGMQELVDTIANRLPAESVRLSRAAVKLEQQRDGWTVTTDDGEKLDASGVVLAAPAYRSAAMVESFAPALVRELRDIPYASTATVSLGYREADFPRALDSFGFVVPAAESRKIIACTFSSVKYAGRAPAGCVLLRAFVGGALAPSDAESDDGTILNNVRQELSDLLGVTAEPLLYRIHRHARAMPQYHVGHRERVARIDGALDQLPALTLAGNAYRGVGIADCIHSGESAAEALLKHLR